MLSTSDVPAHRNTISVFSPEGSTAFFSSAGFSGAASSFFPQAASPSGQAFVGVEVDHLEEVPLELFGKVLPAGTYAYFTPKGKEITTWEDDFYKGWLIKSGYQLSAVGNYSFQVQCYEDDRFKGVDNLEESEIDVYIPIEPAK